MIVEREDRIAISPGEFVRELMEEINMTEQTLSQELSMESDDVHRLLDGDFILTDKIASGLETVFSMSQEYWMNLEKAFRKELSLISA